MVSEVYFPLSLQICRNSSNKFISLDDSILISVHFEESLFESLIVIFFSWVSRLHNFLAEISRLRDINSTRLVLVSCSKQLLTYVSQLLY